MGKFVSTILAVCLLALAIPSTALADTFTVDNITVNYTNNATNLGDIPGDADNNILGLDEDDAIPAYYGTYLTTAGSASTPMYITVEYIGKEAGWTNKLLVNGGTLAFSTATASLGNTVGWAQTTSGRIDFQLVTNKGTENAADDDTVDNTVSGDNPNDVAGTANGANFAVVYLASDWTIDNTSPFTGSNTIASYLTHGTVLKAGLYIFLDDSGAGPDDNHDDLVFRISATAVPEPGTLLLMGLGVAAVGVGARRRRNRTAA